MYVCQSVLCAKLTPLKICDYIFFRLLFKFIGTKILLVYISVNEMHWLNVAYIYKYKYVCSAVAIEIDIA